VKTLIVGYGSIGKRRSGIIAGLYPDWDPPTTVDPVGGDFDDMTDVVDNIKQFGAIFVCTPPAHHTHPLRIAVDAKIPVFVEKPFCLPHQLDSIRDLLDPYRGAVMVGHNFLWHEGFQKFKTEASRIGSLVVYEARFGNRLSQWARENQNPYSLHREEGGGVLLDCLQDIDLALDVTGGLEPKAYHQIDGGAHGVTVTSECAAVVLAQQQGGPVASLVFDYLRSDRIRTHTAVGTEGTVVWEETRGDALDKSYIAETEVFLRWAETGRRPGSVPDPFRALEFVRRIYQL
jgi:predicted dehydrogenase